MKFWGLFWDGFDIGVTNRPGVTNKGPSPQGSPTFSDIFRLPDYVGN